MPSVIEERIRARRIEWGRLENRSPLRKTYTYRVDDPEYRTGTLVLFPIAGKESSPYAGGVFFFRVELPEVLGHGHPRVAMHPASRIHHPLVVGQRINLSLFTGIPGYDGNRKWNRGDSLLRVIEELHRLFDSHPLRMKQRVDVGGRVNLEYNREAFRATMSGVLALLRCPPDEWIAGIVRNHVICNREWFERVRKHPPYGQTAAPKCLSMFEQVVDTATPPETARVEPPRTVARDSAPPPRELMSVGFPPTERVSTPTPTPSLSPESSPKFVAETLLVDERKSEEPPRPRKRRKPARVVQTPDSQIADSQIINLQTTDPQIAYDTGSSSKTISPTVGKQRRKKKKVETLASATVAVAAAVAAAIDVAADSIVSESTTEKPEIKKKRRTTKGEPRRKKKVEEKPEEKIEQAPPPEQAPPLKQAPPLEHNVGRAGRKCPNEPAAKLPVATRQLSENDGRWWRVIETVRGKRWTLDKMK